MKKIKREAESLVEESLFAFAEDRALPGRSELSLLGDGTRRPSKKDSADAVIFTKVCWPSALGQMGSSPL